jgi:hypothetical protein
VANLREVGSASAEVEPRFDWFNTLKYRVQNEQVRFAAWFVRI